MKERSHSYNRATRCGLFCLRRGCVSSVWLPHIHSISTLERVQCQEIVYHFWKTCFWSRSGTSEPEESCLALMIMAQFQNQHNLPEASHTLVQFSSVGQSCPTLWPHESQHARPPCPSPAPRVYSNPCPSSRWCHPAISSSVVPFSSCPQSLPASGSFPMSQLIAWGGQSTGVSASASVLPVNPQDWSPLGWTGWISL